MMATIVADTLTAATTRKETHLAGVQVAVWWSSRGEVVGFLRLVFQLLLYLLVCR